MIVLKQLLIIKCIKAIFHIEITSLFNDFNNWFMRSGENSDTVIGGSLGMQTRGKRLDDFHCCTTTRNNHIVIFP